MLNHARAHESVDAPELIDPEVLEVANKILEIRLGIKDSLLIQIIARKFFKCSSHTFPKNG